MQAMTRMGKDFEESDSDSFAMIVLEGQQPLGDDAHRYYAGLVRELRNDPQHVEHVQDLWGDRLTATSVQSPDGKAVYVQLNLAGNQGTTLGDESVAAVRNIVNRTPPPPGVEVYVTGPAPLVSDTQHSGNRSILKITAVTVVIIFTMLLLVYRSVVTVILLLVMVGVELAAARGIVAFLGHNDILVLSTFAINMLIFLSHRGRNRLRDILRRAVSRGTSGRRGPGNGLLHHLSRGRSRCLGIRFDDRRGNLLPELYPAALLRDHGHPVRSWHAYCCRGRGDAGSGGSGPRKSLRSIRPQAQNQGSAMATDRHRGCQLARAHSGRDIGGRADRSVGAAGLHNKLQRPTLYTRRHSSQCGLCGG